MKLKVLEKNVYKKQHKIFQQSMFLTTTKNVMCYRYVFISVWAVKINGINKHK